MYVHVVGMCKRMGIVLATLMEKTGIRVRYGAFVICGI
jgi:hypothetical protein